MALLSYTGLMGWERQGPRDDEHRKDIRVQQVGGETLGRLFHARDHGLVEETWDGIFC